MIPKPFATLTVEVEKIESGETITAALLEGKLKVVNG